MWRPQTIVGGPFLLGDWKVEPGLNRVSRGHEVVQLEPRVMDVLAVLARRLGQPTSRRDLIDAVWRTEFVADNTLSSAIAELRRVFGDDARHPRYIETISKRGYRIVADIVPIVPDPEPSDPSALAASADGLKLVSEDREYALVVGDNVIGRSSDVDVVVDSSRVSRRHARITVGDDGAVLEDLGSKNGTFVGDERLEGARRLRHGDEIRLGRELMVFRFTVSEGWTLTEHTAIDD